MTNDQLLMTKEKTIIFDLGGVLIDWDPRRLYRKILSSEAEIDNFLTHVCSPDWNAQQDAGRPFEEGVAQLSLQWPDKQHLIEAYHTRWIEMIGGPIEGTVQIMKDLRAAGYPLYALTNWSSETFALVRNEFDFLDWFLGIVVSGEEKLIKPDHAFYHVLLHRYALKPNQTVFIDDSAANIDAANQLGIDAIRFTTPDALHEALRQRGLL